MKALVFVVLAVALMAGPAMANQCPMLTGQLENAVARMNVYDPKVKQGKALIAEAQKLHDGGYHARAVSKADEAAKVLGVNLDKM